MSELTLRELTAAVDREAVAIRSVTRMSPAGGPGDKVFPPTYAVDDRATTQYAMEQRRVGDDVVDAVLLDSVASQANRLELALLDAVERGEIALPVPFVDFSHIDGLADLGRVTVLEAPHRLADAIFRDSLLDGVPFRLSPMGRAFTEARPDNATALYCASPTSLLFGLWDSTGPKGGLGAKYQRALTSEIVGIGAVAGVKTASRIDPLGVEKIDAPLYRHREAAEHWTFDQAEALVEKGKAVMAGGAREQGKPSSVNHGNVTPGLEARAGGVTIDHATQTLVLSLVALRRLRFPTDAAGVALPAERRRQAETAARTALAALGVAAAAYGFEAGADLRSRCLLVPDAEPAFELVGRHGGPPRLFTADAAAAARLLGEAAAQAAEAGLGWPEDEVRLEPAPKLVELVRRSRHLVEAAGGEVA